MFLLLNIGFGYGFHALSIKCRAFKMHNNKVCLFVCLLEVGRFCVLQIKQIYITTHTPSMFIDL